MKVFGVEVPVDASKLVKEGLMLSSYEWAKNAGMKDLLRCAFPHLDEKGQRDNLTAFIKEGAWRHTPASAMSVYHTYRATYGTTLPFDETKGEEIKTETISKVAVVKPKKAVKEFIQKEDRSMNDLTALRQSLMDELKRVQDPSNYLNEDGTVSQEKSEMTFKRAEAVNGIAEQITGLNRLDMDVRKMQLDTVKTALTYGYNVDMSRALGLEVKKD